MTEIEIPYNRDLGPLTDILTRVQRPGDFFAHGAIEIPMPRIDIHGVGTVSFPVPDVQITDIVACCDQAPVGRGSDTVLDTAVRRVWQLAPTQFDIGGKSWPRILDDMLSTVATELGCTGSEISAQLYKLLVYDTGAFFKPHRDTEKIDGMFGTLLIVLPSQHSGGELVLRHAEREVTLDLGGGDVSELKYAAFYADCEHEVRPISAGNRVCLVYNLLLKPADRQDSPVPVAPDHDKEIIAVAEHIEGMFAAPDAPHKMAWLLEHQYTPAGLAFAALKNADAARADVLRQAAARAGCALHLAIVHIEEYGPAEYWGDATGRWGEELEFDDVDSDDYEIIEVSDAAWFIDDWMTPADDEPADYGKLPLEDGELLPAGALDNEAPDEQRIMEATGNEGASFERSYHRAALVIWPRARFVDVLLQAGIHATLAYLEQQTMVAPHSSEYADVEVEMARVVDAWEQHTQQHTPFRRRNDPDASDRKRMFDLLERWQAPELLERFIDNVVACEFEDDEATVLVRAAQQLGAANSGALYARLIQHNMQAAPRGCTALFAGLVETFGSNATPAWSSALQDIGAAIVDALPTIGRPAKTARKPTTSKAKRVDGDMVTNLLNALHQLGATHMHTTACNAIMANKKAFGARAVIVPAMQALHQRIDAPATGSDITRLWQHAADLLLGRSEYPPAVPADWRQKIALPCNCDDCRELKAFAADPNEKTHRFPVRKDRRQHLHQQIDGRGIDMTHVTERKGSPHTLICTKTRRSYQRQLDAYRQDIEALVALAAQPPRTGADQCARINTAQRRCRAVADVDD